MGGFRARIGASSTNHLWRQRFPAKLITSVERPGLGGERRVPGGGGARIAVNPRKEPSMSIVTILIIIILVLLALYLARRVF